MNLRLGMPLGEANHGGSILPRHNDDSSGKQTLQPEDEPKLHTTHTNSSSPEQVPESSMSCAFTDTSEANTASVLGVGNEVYFHLFGVKEYIFYCCPPHLEVRNMDI